MIAYCVTYATNWFLCKHRHTKDFEIKKTLKKYRYNKDKVLRKHIDKIRKIKQEGTEFRNKEYFMKYNDETLTILILNWNFV